jgi:hypothetical protein
MLYYAATPAALKSAGAPKKAVSLHLSESRPLNIIIVHNTQGWCARLKAFQSVLMDGMPKPEYTVAGANT